MTVSKIGGVKIEKVKTFWEGNPVAAEGISYEWGSAEYFQTFDALREDDSCEPLALSNAIHGYTEAGGRKVLDIGCGNGYVLFQYARHGAEVTGVDLTRTAVELSSKRFALGNMLGEFLEVDGNNLPFPDNHFDIVCSMGVLHHISDPRPITDEIYRVLKPGGRLIAMLYNRHSWKNVVLLRVKRLFDPRYRGKSHQEALNMNDGDDCPLALVYSRGEAAQLFAKFSEIEFRPTQLSWRQFLMLPPLVKLAEWFLPPASKCWPARIMGWNLNISANKPTL